MLKIGNVINLDNNVCLKIIDSSDNVLTNTIDIENIKSIKKLQKQKVMLKIDFNVLKKERYKKVLKELLHMKKKFLKQNKIKIKNEIQIEEIKIKNKSLIKDKTEIKNETKANYETEINNESKKIIGYVVNYDESNMQQKDFISAINAIFYNTRYERYNYIYDTVCDYLDSFFYGKNLCDFENNKCGEKRNTSSTTGCCHHAKIKCLTPILKLSLCEYLKDDYTCGAKCISCKLFTCDYLEKKGIKFRIKDILLLDVFFNPIQKYFIKYMVFTPKDKIIKRLIHT